MTLDFPLEETGIFFFKVLHLVSLTSFPFPLLFETEKEIPDTEKERCKTRLKVCRKETVPIHDVSNEAVAVYHDVRRTAVTSVGALAEPKCEQSRGVYCWVSLRAEQCRISE